MLIFVVLILAGFFFIWKKGVLDWAQMEQGQARKVTIRLDLTPAPSKSGKAELTPSMIPEDLRGNPWLAGAG